MAFVSSESAVRSCVITCQKMADLNRKVDEICYNFILQTSNFLVSIDLQL